MKVSYLGLESRRKAEADLLALATSVAEHSADSCRSPSDSSEIGSRGACSRGELRGPLDGSSARAPAATVAVRDDWGWAVCQVSCCLSVLDSTTFSPLFSTTLVLLIIFKPNSFLLKVLGMGLVFLIEH